MNKKTIDKRLDELEANSQQHQDNDHSYRQVIAWEENDKIMSRYYKDGIEITRSQYERESKPKPGEKINVIITEADEKGGGEND